MLIALQTELQNWAQPQRAAVVSRYFRTGPGQYGEGDVFIGIPNPQLRQLAKKFLNLPPDDIHTLLNHPIHEYRFVALLILVGRFRQAGVQERREWCELYLANLPKVNNWDLVDVSARDILGEFLLTLDRSLLDQLAESGHLWSQRVAIIATQAFIRRGQFDDALRLAEYYLTHRHDLIHKASGWTLREIGRKNGSVLRTFLSRFAPQMPRTMLRYAIEHLPEAERFFYRNQR
ncbi:MAG: DNA alkylation repair protein [Cytophagaceae bacterium]|nr:DNA alkylation repair protein [Cytophagaceae bacterium]